jgi:hypothetical protein
MLGGMSGGGMGFIFNPQVKPAAQAFLGEAMSVAKAQMQHALPFAMEPVVYDFAINEQGTWARLLSGAGAMMPAGYYALMVPGWLKSDPRDLRPMLRRELETFGAVVRGQGPMSGMVQTLFDRLVPKGVGEQTGTGNLAALLEDNGFDREHHESIRTALRAGRIGLAQNRLPATSTIEDVRDSDVTDARRGVDADCLATGRKAISAGEVAVVTLAAGAGTRWTQGAGVVKALHPFAKLAGKHRNFLDVHLAKARRVRREFQAALPLIVTTSYLTDAPIRQYVEAQKAQANCPGPLLLSPGRAVGLRLVPMVRDLRFAWEEMAHQVLDEQRQKVRDSLHAALIDWARQSGEGADYTDNLPHQCLHPVGHWFEIPNLLRNGVLAGLLHDRPQLRYLMLHNIDTLGTGVDPGLLGLFMQRQWCLGLEVITRRLEDRGGGLARVDGRTRLVEGLAMPREDLEFDLTYYNTLTTWIDIDKTLGVFGLSRSDLADAAKVSAAIRQMAQRIPTYVTLKDVKKRWGQGQEDVYPVAQFEKLWGDMTSLPEFGSEYVVVSRRRGQQLKEVAQLDTWLRDGSAGHIESLCGWT